MVAAQPNLLAQILDRGREEGVGGKAQNFCMESLVRLEESVDRPGARRFLQAFVQLPQLPGRRLVQALGGPARGVPLEHGEHVEDRIQLFAGDLADEGAAPRDQGHQPFGGEHLQGLAQGGTRDAVFGRQAQLVDRLSRR